MKTIKVLSTLFALMLLPFVANATPTLQLDCDPCEYDSVTEDTVATVGVFDLGFIINDGGDEGSLEEYDDFWFSIALVGEYDGTEDVASINAIFAGLLIGGQTLDEIYGVDQWTAHWGSPPSDALTPPGSNTLPDHGHAGWYVEILITDGGGLNWTNDLQECGLYNVQENPGYIDWSGTGAQCADIEIDRSGIDGSIGLHFDFYTTVDEEGCRNVGGGEQECGTYTNLGINAPFSKDVTSVPEPGTLSLLGLGLLALGLGRRRREIA